MTTTTHFPSWTLIPSVVAFDVNAGFDALKVAQVMVDKSSHSWEWGTAAEALLELYTNGFSVFGENPFPNGAIPKTSYGVVALTYAKSFIALDSQTLCRDTAAGDPASLGVCAILLGQSDSKYLDAANRQANFLLNKVPKSKNGAISHRTELAELWSDNVAMSFPFLAYQAVQQQDPTLMVETVRQIGLYRSALQNKQNLYWHHIIGEGSAQDLGAWSTGNGWAAYGMVRVLYTLERWSGSSSMITETNQLKSWIKEILDAAMSSRTQDGLLRNYWNDRNSFGEIAGTAVLTAVAYRMVVNDSTIFTQEYVDWAEKNRMTLAGMQRHDGVVAPAVYPYDWKNMRKDLDGSAEGQAFMVHLYTAYRDCVHAGICRAALPYDK